MRLAFLTVFLGVVVAATGAVACGDSSGSGGSGGSGNGGTGGSGSVDCTKTDWDCATVCANLATVCMDSTCGDSTDGCNVPDCEASCGEVKAGLAQIPAEQLKYTTSNFNCLEANNACLAYGYCIAGCIR